MVDSPMMNTAEQNRENKNEIAAGVNAWHNAQSLFALSEKSFYFLLGVLSVELCLPTAIQMNVSLFVCVAAVTMGQFVITFNHVSMHAF